MVFIRYLQRRELKSNRLPAAKGGLLRRLPVLTSKRRRRQVCVCVGGVRVQNRNVVSPGRAAQASTCGREVDSKGH